MHVAVDVESAMRLFLFMLLTGWLTSPALAFNSYWNRVPLNPFERVVLYNSYDCPYPTGNTIVRQLDEHLWELVIETGGNICFDREYETVEYAFDLGVLPAGAHTLRVVHTADLDFYNQWQEVPLVVENVLPEAFSGLWANPAQPGHGLQLTVDDNGQLVVMWMAYDRTGNSKWLFGTAENTGSHVAVEMYAPEGMTFPDFLPETLNTPVWGQLQLDFSDCTHAQLRWDAQASGYGTGSMPIELALPATSIRCDRGEE